LKDALKLRIETRRSVAGSYSPIFRNLSAESFKRAEKIERLSKRIRKTLKAN
jgi:hypothetical protein